MQWPPGYVIHSCNPWTDPDVLPPPYNKPVVEDGDCSQIVMGYEDLVFDINPPVFKKNLRKWTVLDGCIYNPNDWDPVGIWEHTQVIKIVPEYPPLIWCPNDTIVTADGDCSGGYVNLLPATGSSDCGADVIITNHSPYAILGGADASGHYTLGFVPVKAEFTGLSEFNMPGLTEDYFGMHEISHGKISSVWFDTEPLTAARSFFTLNFRALESLDTESLLELNTRSTQALAYNSDGVEHIVS